MLINIYIFRGCRGLRFEIQNCKFPIPHYQLACTARCRLVARLAADSPFPARLFQDRGAGLSPCAGTPRFEATSRDTRSSQHAGHALPEGTARARRIQRSWHLQRSLPAQSEDLRTEVWLAESLRRRAARPTPRSHWLLDENRVFRIGPNLAPCAPPRLGTRRARVHTRRYLWSRLEAPHTVAVFNHLRA